MTDETRLAPIVLIISEALLHRAGEPFRRVFLVIPQIGIREVEIHRRRENEAVVLGHVLEESGRMIDEELVGIEPAPPVSRRSNVASRFKYVSTEFVGKRPVVVANELDSGVAIGEILERLPGPIDTSVVKDKDPIAPPKSRLQRLLDNVILVSNAANAEYLHVADHPLYRRRLPTHQVALTRTAHCVHPLSGGILDDRAVPAPLSS